MISAYVSSEGIVVHSESNAVLITQSTLDDYVRFSTDPGRDELGYSMSYVYKLSTLAHSAAGRVKESGYIVHNPKINYQVGKEYTGKQLQNNPIEGMIIKRADYHRPFAYVDGSWTLGYGNVTLMQDGQYQVLYVPEDN